MGKKYGRIWRLWIYNSRNAIGRVYWTVLEAGWREGILREVLTVWLVRFQCRARDLSGMELEAICVIAWQEIRLHSAHILRI